MSDQNQRDKMLQRILNLRAKAEADGASEAEMNTAFNLAVKLMETYNIAEAELAIAENEGRIVLDVINKVADTDALVRKHLHKVIMTLSGIAKFTQTKAVYSAQTGKITFTGHRPDTEFAQYILAVVKEALDREYDIYRNRTPAVGYGAKSGFQQAMARRINSRLYEMASEAESDRNKAKQEALREVKRIEDSSTASSTALIVADLVAEKYKATDSLYTKTYPKLGATKTFRNSSNGNAYSAGISAGDKVSFSKGLNNTQRKIA